MQPSFPETRLVLIASTALILLLGIILVISINITRKRKIRLKKQLDEESLKLQQAELNYERELLEKQKAQFERQKAIELERARISAELHDDMGGELSAIRLLSEMSTSNINPQQQLSKISLSSGELVQKLNEIVWALNVNNDSLHSLIAYIRRYAVKRLDDAGIACIFKQPENIPDNEVDGITRRNIFLIVKETLNNIIKHSDAEKAEITIAINDVLRIIIHDNGKGIPAEMIQQAAGNGLKNMQQRVKDLTGAMEITNQEGTLVQFDLPMPGTNTKR